MSIKAFVDNGYPQGKEFCVQFLSSSEFTVSTLRHLAKSSSNSNKRDIALQLTNSLEQGNCSYEQILLTYVRQSKMWLSLKQGTVVGLPQLKSPTQLFTEFGEEDWYGPIEDINSSQHWYIRIYKIPHYVRRGSGFASQVDECSIRWSVIAQVSSNYIALSWNGFSVSSSVDPDTSVQFPFWKHIPSFFNELTNHCEANCSEIKLHKLVLFDMWNKYLENTQYKWQHLRIRAEASGVALNAHSAGITELELDVNGLQALSRQLAISALEAMGYSDDIKKINCVENALLHTLIKEWGSKSYEFSLEKLVNPNEVKAENLGKQTLLEKLFKAHCYFGLKPNSKTQDSLEHLKCYSNYGGSTSILKFILEELGL